MDEQAFGLIDNPSAPGISRDQAHQRARGLCRCGDKGYAIYAEKHKIRGIRPILRLTIHK
jgi:hypothetical protein